MAQLDEMFHALLSDPGSMAQIMQLAQQFSGSQATPVPQEDVPPQPETPQIPTNTSTPSGGFDSGWIGKLLPLLQEYSRSDSNTMQLLLALQPFLKPEKQDKIQRAAKLARLIHLGKRVLTEWEV